MKWPFYILLERSKSWSHQKQPRPTTSGPPSHCPTSALGPHRVQSRSAAMEIRRRRCGSGTENSQTMCWQWPDYKTPRSKRHIVFLNTSEITLMPWVMPELTGFSKLRVKTHLSPVNRKINTNWMTGANWVLLLIIFLLTTLFWSHFRYFDVTSTIPKSQLDQIGNPFMNLGFVWDT